MKEKKTIMLNLLNMLEAFELTREDYAEFVRELMKRFNLSLSDCFAETEVATVLQKVKEKCNELLQVAETLPLSENTLGGLNCGMSDSKLLMQSEAPLEETALDNTVAEMVGVTDNTGAIPIEDENGVIGWVGRAEELPTQSKDCEITEQSSCPPKGYSRNGRKLGRPRKQQPADTKVVSSKLPENAEVNKVVENVSESSVKTDTKSSDAVSAEPITPPAPPGSENQPDNGAFTDEEKATIEKLKMGKEYNLEILYQWQKRFVISSQVMQEATPIGVFVPYQRRGAGFSKFILSVNDEISGLPLTKAQAYARNKMQPYQNERWQVLDSWQIEAAKQAQPELNQILKKIGGDPFTGSYLVPKTANYHKMPDKIRYAVNVR